MFKYPFDTNFLKFYVMATAQETIQNPYKPIADQWRNASRDWKRDAAKQATISGAEFDADLALLDYQNQYNDPTAQAERLRAAGINPDLVGLDGVSDSAGLSGVTGSSGISTGPSSMEKAQFWLSNGQNIFNSALQLADQFQTMRGRSLDNDIKNIDYVRALQGLKNDAYSEILANSYIKGDSENIDPLIFVRGISNRNKKRFQRLMPSYSSKIKSNKLVGDIVDSSLNAGESLAVGNIRGSGSFNPNDMAKGYEHVAKFLEKVKEYAARQDAAQAKYNADYYENSDGSNDALIDKEMRETARDSAKDSYQASKGDKELDKYFSELVTDLRKDDSWYSNALLMILYGMKSGAFRGAVDFYTKVRPTPVKSKSR